MKTPLTELIKKLPDLEHLMHLRVYHTMLEEWVYIVDYLKKDNKVAAIWWSREDSYNLKSFRAAVEGFEVESPNTWTDEQRAAMVIAVESNIKNLQDLGTFLSIFGRTRKFSLCSDEFIQRAYDYLVRKGAIK